MNECCDQLQASLSQIHRLLDKVNAGLKSVHTLASQYAFVEEKSNSLHTACQSLMTEQEQLSRYSQDVTSRLTYYNEVKINENVKCASLQHWGILADKIGGPCCAPKTLIAFYC